MVKISGPQNRPSAFDFISGATYVGDSRVINLAVFLKQSDPSRVLLRTGSLEIKEVDYREFARVVKYLEIFAVSQNETYISPDPNPLRVSVVLLEGSRILLRLEKSSTVLLPVDFFQVLNVLVAIRKKMESLAHKAIDRKTRLDESSVARQLYDWGGLISFALLAAFDFSLFVSLFFRPELYLHWIALTLFLILWPRILKPSWASRLWPNLRAYVNEDMLNDLSNLHFPRRGVEIFLIITTVIFFYILFGSDFAHFIMRHYQKKLATVKSGDSAQNGSEWLCQRQQDRGYIFFVLDQHKFNRFFWPKQMFPKLF